MSSDWWHKYCINLTYKVHEQALKATGSSLREVAYRVFGKDIIMTLYPECEELSIKKFNAGIDYYPIDMTPEKAQLAIGKDTKVTGLYGSSIAASADDIKIARESLEARANFLSDGIRMPDDDVPPETFDP